MGVSIRLTVSAIAVCVFAGILSFWSGKIVALPPPVQGKNNTVLFVVADHWGLNNVHYATISALLEHHPEVEIHLASFPSQGKELDKVSQFAQRRNPGAVAPVFHGLPGTSHKGLTDLYLGNSENAVNRRGPRALSSFNRNAQFFLSPWPLEEHLTLFKAIGAVINKTDPSVVALDVFFPPGLDAVRFNNRLSAVVSPNMASDNFVNWQPWGQMFWRYPVYVLLGGLPSQDLTARMLY